MRPMLVFIRHHEINGRLYRHSEELPPGVLDQETVHRLLDQRVLTECPERRSLYRLFSHFSGCAQTEALTQEELTDFTLSR